MKTKDIKGRMRAYFFLHPTIKLRVRHIEREVKVPLPSVIRYTKELEKEGVLKSTKIANITIYSADRSSRNYLLEKKLFNIHQLNTSGLIDFLMEEFSNPVMVVFGSYARGEDTVPDCGNPYRDEDLHPLPAPVRVQGAGRRAGSLQPPAGG